MADDAYERLLASDEIWFPEGQPIGAAHDDIVGQPIELSRGIEEGGTAYIIRAVTGSDGKVTVEYASPEAGASN
jgi:hypothetical protein